VTEGTSVGELQSKIDNEHFIPVASQYLVAKNNVLSGNADAYLSDFGLEDQDTIELMLRVNGGMRAKWRKKRMRRLRRKRRKMRQRAR